MEWSDALQYQETIASIAREWARRMGDPDLSEDIENIILIGLVEKVDVSGAMNPLAYVKGAAWKIARKYAMSKSERQWRKLLSWNEMESEGFQIDDDGDVRITSRTQMVDLDQNAEEA
jgi:hypothetical protein